MEQRQCSLEEAEVFEAELKATGYDLKADEPMDVYACSLVDAFMLYMDDVPVMMLSNCSYLLAIGPQAFMLGSKFLSVLHMADRSNVADILEASLIVSANRGHFTAYVSPDLTVSYALIRFDTIEETMICTIELQ